MVTRTINVGAGALAVAEAGAGGTPLLLVHGWTGSKEDFADWMAPLAGAGHHVVAPDHRGHGASHKPDDEADYSLDLMAAEMFDLADALGWDRFALLGHSMGGMVVQKMAIARPDRLRGLVLMDTHHGPLDVDRVVVDLGVEMARTHGTGVIADMMAAATEPGPLDTEAYQRVCAERPGHFERGVEMTRVASSAMFAAMLLEMASTPSRLDDLASLGVPTLVIVGDQDLPFIPASEALAAVIPGARFELLADAGHSPQFEAPDAWWAAMSTFLDGLPAD